MREDQLPRIKDCGSSSEAHLEALLRRSSDDPRSTFPTILRTRSSLVDRDLDRTLNHTRIVYSDHPCIDSQNFESDTCHGRVGIWLRHILRLTIGPLHLRV